MVEISFLLRAQGKTTSIHLCYIFIEVTHHINKRIILDQGFIITYLH